MRRSKKFMLAGVVLVVGVVAGIALSSRHSALADTSGCATKGVTHQVVIKDNHVSPEFTDGARCDVLTITNKDDVSREISFGPHEEHVAYDGIAEKVLNLDQNLTVTLNQTGMYHFHDHIHDEVMGYFTVAK